MPQHARQLRCAANRRSATARPAARRARDRARDRPPARTARAMIAMQRRERPQRREHRGQRSHARRRRGCSRTRRCSVIAHGRELAHRVARGEAALGLGLSLVLLLRALQALDHALQLRAAPDRSRPSAASPLSARSCASCAVAHARHAPVVDGADHQSMRRSRDPLARRAAVGSASARARSARTPRSPRRASRPSPRAYRPGALGERRTSTLARARVLARALQVADREHAAQVARLLEHGGEPRVHARACASSLDERSSASTIARCPST